MENFKEQILNILFDLKINHSICALKAEYEAEGASFDEVMFLKKISKELNLKLSVKISGPQAMRDIYELKKIAPDNIIAPMIESSYAAYKFADSIEKVFDKKNVPKAFINIETAAGFNCLDEILSSFFGEKIGGIVVGRSDLCNSINFKNSEKISPDSDIILNYAVSGGVIAKKYGKKLIIGGLVTEGSIPFFKKLKADSNLRIDGFETRKIVFNEDSIENPGLNEGILKALEFEILWLKNRINTPFGTNEDKKRLEDIQNRYYYYKR